MPHQKTPGTLGGSRLRALRETSGRTQLDVELEASLGTGYLQRLELGKVQYPERDTLERLLAALGSSFVERREILGLFGYAVTFSIPDETETRWAIDVFRSEVEPVGIPTYLLDCSHRFLAWNAMVEKVFEAVNSLSEEVLIPRLIFDPAYGIAPAVLNAETFFPAQIRILEFERLRSGDEAWYSGFLDKMRECQAFDAYWDQCHKGGRVQVPMRPTAQLILSTGRDVVHFRLISETFAQDPRFRVIYYLPAEPATIRQFLAWQSQLAALPPNTSTNGRKSALRI